MSGTAIDHAAVLHVALAHLFADVDDRRTAETVLSGIPSPSGWRPRVGLAALRLCGADLDRLRAFVAERHDYRDVVSMAEYPLQGAEWRLRRTDPARHRELVAEDLRTDEAWMRTVSANG